MSLTAIDDRLIRHVPATYLGAIQGIAALEQRIAEMRSWPGDFTSEIAAADAFLRAIRSTFDIHVMSEDEIDAAHEAAVAAMDALIRDDMPDVPLALYPSKLDEYQSRGA